MGLIAGPWAPLTGRTLYALPLARELGKTTRQIETWQEEGMPYGTDPHGHHVFSLLEVLAWLDGRDAA